MAFSGQGALGGAAAGASAGAAAGPWGAAIGGVLGALGGGFMGGRKGDDYHPEVWRNDAYKNYLKQVQAIRDASKQFGFHPLALMGQMGAQPVGVYGVHGQSGSGDWSSDAIGALTGTAAGLYRDDVDSDRYDDARFDAILRDQARIGEESRAEKINEALAAAQLEEVRSRTLLNHFRMQQIGGAQQGADPVTLTDAFGVQLQPKNTGAQVYADQYGDIISEGYGLTNWLKDTFTNPDTGEGLAREWLRKKGVLSGNPFMR